MRKILLSFDIEEFDMPLEYGKEISFVDQIQKSQYGTTLILDLLKKYKVKATFFSTVIFANESRELIGRIISEGHELASHSYYHSKFEEADLRRSKIALEGISKTQINGFRMPRMMPVNDQALSDAGYTYNSSINPTWLPGRYNHMDKPRTFYPAGRLTHIPSSVSPYIRFPLFWLSFHNLPLGVYQWLCKRTIHHDGYVNIYFHPWEFCDLRASGLPSYVSKDTGDRMRYKFEKFLIWASRSEFEFDTIANFLDQCSAA